MQNNNIDRDIFMCISFGIAVFVVGFSKRLAASPCWNCSIPGLTFLFSSYSPIPLSYSDLPFLRGSCHVTSPIIVFRILYKGVDSVGAPKMTQLGCGRRG